MSRRTLCNCPALSPLLCTAFLFAVIAMATGCDMGPQLGQITGTITYNGKPLTKGTIIFEVAGQRQAIGQIENGKVVEVTTNEKGDGVPVGLARIAINSLEEVPQRRASNARSSEDNGAPIDTSEMVPVRLVIPHKYANPTTSELTAEIRRGENVVEFELVD